MVRRLFQRWPPTVQPVQTIQVQSAPVQAINLEVGQQPESCNLSNWAEGRRGAEQYCAQFYSAKLVSE